MRVLHVIPSVSPRSGGPGRVIIEMSRALRDRGIELQVATTDADLESRLDVELEKSLMYKGVPVIFFPKQLNGFTYSRPLARWLDENVAGYDVVHIHAVFSHACVAAARACRRQGVPYIVRPLGTLDPWSMRQKPLRKHLFWHAGVKRLLADAAAVHYTSELEKQAVEDTLGLKRGVFIRLGVENNFSTANSGPSIFRQKFPLLGDNPYVILLSRLHPKKNPDLLLRAFLSLKDDERFKRWNLVLAGEGEADYVESLKRLAQDGGANERVLFTGWLDGELKDSALKGASLLALPSSQENFGVCVIEALGSGVPVLISPHVNLAPEIESAGVGWIASLEETALRDALAEALADDDGRARRGREGKSFAQKYSWPEIACELEQLYRSIIISNGFGNNGKRAAAP